MRMGGEAVRNAQQLLACPGRERGIARVMCVDVSSLERRKVVGECTSMGKGEHDSAERANSYRRFVQMFSQHGCDDRAGDGEVATESPDQSGGSRRKAWANEATDPGSGDLVHRGI